MIDAYGKTVDECPMCEEGIAQGTMDLAALAAFRAKFPVLNDAD